VKQKINFCEELTSKEHNTKFPFLKTMSLDMHYLEPGGKQTRGLVHSHDKVQTLFLGKKQLFFPPQRSPCNRATHHLLMIFNLSVENNLTEVGVHTKTK
jgi:hypothetical protein